MWLAGIAPSASLANYTVGFACQQLGIWAGGTACRALEAASREPVRREFRESTFWADDAHSARIVVVIRSTRIAGDANVAAFRRKCTIFANRAA
eukprot:SAG11_NODE_30801_length_297_cov_1.111111_1_plen_93_part_10